MADTKPRQSDSLRTPKPKKKLGLSVPPALRLPHEDLISPPAKTAPEPTLPKLKAQAEPSLPSQTSLTRQTSPSAQTETQPIAPQKDFTRVANSIGREAVPAGVFAGKSKQLYDYLYSITRGAIVPTRTVRISRTKLMKQAGIGSRVTFEANIERLVWAGLVRVRPIAGEHHGSEYTVLLPEEIVTDSHTMPSQTSLTGYAQKLVRLVSLETSQTRHTSSSEESTSYDTRKTFSKTSGEKTDDEPFGPFLAALRDAATELTGKPPGGAEAARWRELGELLAAELKIAAARTQVSSVPAFFTEHLRRRLWKIEPKGANAPASGPAETGQKDEANAAEGSTPTPEQVRSCPDCAGTGFYYPRGFEGGVARCRHENVGRDAPEKSSDAGRSVETKGSGDEASPAEVAPGEDEAAEGK